MRPDRAHQHGAGIRTERRRGGQREVRLVEGVRLGGAARERAPFLDDGGFTG